MLNDFSTCSIFYVEIPTKLFSCRKSCVPTQSANPHRELGVEMSRPCTSSNSNARTDISSPIVVFRGILYINCASTPLFSLCSSKTVTSTRKSSVSKAGQLTCSRGVDVTCVQLLSFASMTVFSSRSSKHFVVAKRIQECRLDQRAEHADGLLARVKVDGVPTN